MDYMRKAKMDADDNIRELLQQINKNFNVERRGAVLAIFLAGCRVGGVYHSIRVDPALGTAIGKIGAREIELLNNGQPTLASLNAACEYKQAQAEKDAGYVTTQLQMINSGYRVEKRGCLLNVYLNDVRVGADYHSIHVSPVAGTAVGKYGARTSLLLSP